MRMPFRVPTEYESLDVESADPTDDELAAYADWLREELAAAEAVLKAREADKPKE